MKISGKTRVFLVVGDPVTQVQAPQVFNALFEAQAIDAVLVPAQIDSSRLAAFARGVMAARNIDGLWVTIPHKTDAATLVDRCDPQASLAGSVNAVRRDADGALSGGLFDGTGFVKAIRHFGFDPQGRSALLVGTGGAGSAIAAALLGSGLRRLALHDLGDRAATLAGRLAPHAGSTDVVAASADPQGYDLVINATPLGLKPDDPLPFDVARVARTAMVVDILMKHRPTPLLRACHGRGIDAFPGFEMLVQQVPDYLDFFGLHDDARAVSGQLADVRSLFLAP